MQRVRDRKIGEIAVCHAVDGVRVGPGAIRGSDHAVGCCVRGDQKANRIQSTIPVDLSQDRRVRVVVGHIQVAEPLVQEVHPVVAAVVIRVKHRADHLVGFAFVENAHVIRVQARPPPDIGGGGVGRVRAAQGVVEVRHVVRNPIADIHVHVRVGVRNGAGKSAARIVRAEDQLQGLVALLQHEVVEDMEISALHIGRRHVRIQDVNHGADADIRRVGRSGDVVDRHLCEVLVRLHDS